MTAFYPLLILAVTAVLVVILSMFLKRDIIRAEGPQAATHLLFILLGGTICALYFSRQALSQLLILANLLGIILLICASKCTSSRYSAGDMGALALISALAALSVEVLESNLFLFIAALFLQVVVALAMAAIDNRGTKIIIPAFILLVALLVSSFGAGLVYGTAGTIVTADLVSQIMVGTSKLLNVGLLLVIIGVLTACGLVPFHFWQGELYRKNSIPVVAILSTLLPLNGFFFLCKIQPILATVTFAGGLFGIVATVSVIVAALMIWEQRSLRMLVTYISLFLSGQVLLGITIVPASIFHAELPLGLFSYLFVMLGLFAVLQTLEENWGGGFEYSKLRGLYSSSRGAALIMALLLLTVCAFPLTSGFSTLFLLWKGLISSGHSSVAIIDIIALLPIWWVVLKLLFIMFASADNHESRPIFSNYLIFLLLLIVTLLVLLGVAPDIWLSFINK